MIQDGRKNFIRDIINDKKLLDKTISQIVTNENGSLAIFYMNTVDIPENLKKASGFIFYDNGGSKFNIIINNDTSETRKKFVTAHELGHYFLHNSIIKVKGPIIDGSDRGYLFSRAGGYDSIYRELQPEEIILEEEANFFAAEFLMPEETVRVLYNDLKKSGFDALGKLAEGFGVSETAMAYRLINLGLLDTNE